MSQVVSPGVRRFAARAWQARTRSGTQRILACALTLYGLVHTKQPAFPVPGERLPARRGLSWDCAVLGGKLILMVYKVTALLKVRCS
jgi:hypothetical protein